MIHRDESDGRDKRDFNKMRILFKKMSQKLEES